jgi:hypothetical protein
VTSEEVLEGSPELSMIMLIDTLGERYGRLPSEVIRSATTFDVFVADTAIAYRNAQMDRANGNNQLDPSKYSEDDLLKVLKESRGEN